MSTSGLFNILFDVLDGSPDYMVSGSLSFLPLLGGYRNPGEDLDVFIRRDVFEQNKRACERVGVVHVLRVPEVALAGTALVSKVFVPKTGFVHLETSEGVLDIGLYEEDDVSMQFIFGLGIRFAMTRAFCAGCSQLRWNDHCYKAAPAEFMFLTKAVGYVIAIRHGKALEYEGTKHFDDLLRMSPIIDWEFARELLESLHVRWKQTRFPGWIQQRLNPYAVLDLSEFREELARAQALQ